MTSLITFCGAARSAPFDGSISCSFGRYHGRLALLLDGWNELTPQARLRATRDIGALQRDYPLLGLVITTRLPAPPVTGPTITIEPLSQGQQIELARAVRGQDGENLVDRAWRTSGVSELMGIPLYLSALYLHCRPVQALSGNKGSRAARVPCNSKMNRR